MPRPLIPAIMLLLAAGATQALADAPPDPTALVVCADPANLPYSNRSGEGFENRIATLIAADLHADLRYFWFPQHKSFFRKTLLDGACDVVMSVPVGLPMVAATQPYFTSSYAVVTRTDDPRHFAGFDDAWLVDAKIGLQLVGNEGMTTPPAVALATRGLNDHIVGFPMWGDEGEVNPQGRIVDAVADGSIDVAFVWGPFAGYFAKAHGAALRVEPVAADPQMPGTAFVFPMAMGVRKKDTAFRDQLQAAIDRHRGEIAAILQDYAIPVPPRTAPQTN